MQNQLKNTTLRGVLLKYKIWEKVIKNPDAVKSLTVLTEQEESEKLKFDQRLRKKLILRKRNN